MASNLKWNIILVGENGVGKTSLCTRFAKNTFTRNYNPTAVVERFCKKIKMHDYEIDLQIWATSGKEHFKSFIVQYFQLAHGCILVYDVTKVATFHQLSVWLSEFRTFNKRAPVIIAGNKNEDSAIKLESLKLEIDQEDLKFIECSAKSGENVNNVFESLVQKIWENTHPEPTNNIDGMNSSSLQKPKDSNSANYEKHVKCPTHCLDDESSLVQEKSDETMKFVQLNAEKSVNKKNVDNFFVQKECDKKFSIHEKVNDSFQAKSNEFKKPIKLNDRCSSVPQKVESNFPTLKKYDKYTQQPMLGKDNSYVHQKFNDYFPVVKNFGALTQSLLINSSIHYKADADKFWVDDKSGKPIKLFEMKETNSSNHQKFQANNFCVDDKSGKPIKPLVIKDTNSSFHQKSIANSFIIDDKLNKSKLSVTLNERNSSIQTLKFIIVIKLGSKKYKKIPVLKLS